MRPDRQRFGIALGQADMLPRLLPYLDERQRVALELAPRLCQLRPGFRPGEQRFAKRILQPLYPQADRRLRHKQTLARIDEGSGGRDLEKGPQKQIVHVSYP